MKVLLWNVRGCNTPDKVHLMKRCLDQAKPDLLFLQETKLKGQLSLPKGVLANGNGAFWMLLVHLEA